MVVKEDVTGLGDIELDVVADAACLLGCCRPLLVSLFALMEELDQSFVDAISFRTDHDRKIDLIFGRKGQNAEKDELLERRLRKTVCEFGRVGFEIVGACKESPFDYPRTV